MKMRTCFTWVCLAQTLVLAPGIRATESPAWHQALKSTVLSEGQALAEVHRYLAERVPVVPALTSASDWQAEAARLRKEVLARVVYRGRAAQWRDAPTRVEWLDTIPGGPGYHIRKLLSLIHI